MINLIEKYTFLLVDKERVNNFAKFILIRFLKLWKS